MTAARRLRIPVRIPVRTGVRIEARTDDDDAGGEETSDDRGEDRSEDGRRRCGGKEVRIAARIVRIGVRMRHPRGCRVDTAARCCAVASKPPNVTPERRCPKCYPTRRPQCGDDTARGAATTMRRRRRVPPSAVRSLTATLARSTKCPPRPRSSPGAPEIFLVGDGATCSA